MMMKLKLAHIFIASLLLYNFAFFLLKSGQAIAGNIERDATLAESFILKHIPSGSKVLGEPLYYYAVTNAGSDFQYLNLYEDLELREQFHREQYDYDYLIVTNHLQMRDAKGCIPYYLNKSTFVKVAELENKQSALAESISNISIGGFTLLSNVEKHGYNCVIYKRIKKQ